MIRNRPRVGSAFYQPDSSAAASAGLDAAARNSNLTFFVSLLLFTYTLVAPSIIRATTIDFEGFADSTVLANKYSSLTFTNAIVLSIGIGVNEFEFPPHSGINVASDNNGPLSIAFSSPIASFSGYFTYYEQLSLQAFSASSAQVASATSAFSINVACDPGPTCLGDPGSSPNEFLQVSFASGISSITITGDPAGGSFVMDDITYTSPTPEPGTFGLFLTAVLGVIAPRRFKVLRP